MKIEKSFKKLSILDIFTISPLQRPRGFSQNVSGLYYVRSGSGYKIHMCVKLYYLGRAKVFSSVATDFGSWTIILINTMYLYKNVSARKCIKTANLYMRRYYAMTATLCFPFQESCNCCKTVRTKQAYVIVIPK